MVQYDILSAFPDSDGANSQITLSKRCLFSYHVLSTACFLQGTQLDHEFSEYSIHFYSRILFKE